MCDGVFISGVQQSYTHTYIHFFPDFFSHIGYYRITVLYSSSLLIIL